MPIESPLLDDLRYDRVVEEIVRRIPVYSPEWTDFNESDPGITLIQLFAYLAEQVGYRLNRIPEKNHIELLKLLGIRLEPAHAATSRVAFLLADPAGHPGYPIPQGTRITRKGSPAVYFETDVVHDTVPAEMRVLIATKNPYLWDLRLLNDVTHQREEDDPPPEDLDFTSPDDTPWMVVAWDGQDPKLKDMPLEPVTMLPTPTTKFDPLPYLWVGLDFNPDRDAGFKGVTVTLTVQLDDDEQPDPKKSIECAPIVAPGEEAPPPIDWLAYFDDEFEPEHTMVTVPGRIVNSTDKLTRSGTIKFTIPFTFGAIDRDYADVVDAFPTEPPSALEACEAVRDAINGALPTPGAEMPGFAIDLAAALTDAANAATAAAIATPAIPHPLQAKYRDPSKIKGWLRIGPLDVSNPSPKVRHIGFNVVPVTHAETVTGQLLGRSDGRPGQVFNLGRQNIFADTIEVAIAESTDPAALLTTWTRVDSLDGAGPFDRVFDLDAEAGILTFGDGQRGRIPPLVPRSGNVIAVRYRFGGGVVGESEVGTLTTSAAQVVGIGAVTNIVKATGGIDAETVEQAKVRARKELSTRTRAVTASDFEWIALRTKGVRVARAIVVPRRRPLPASMTDAQLEQKKETAAQAAANAQVLCNPCFSSASTSAGASSTTTMLPLPPGTPATCGTLPDQPVGLDDELEAPGVVTVVVVPDEPNHVLGSEPLPTPSFLRAVCKQLDAHRLVTTEVHVAPPQYVRICEVTLRVKAKPGYSRLMVQELVTASLAQYLDVLEGGQEGAGAPFGGQVHIADLIARVFRTEGVERVEEMTANFARTKSNVDLRTGKLRICPTAANEVDHLDLGPEETTSFDATSLALSTVD